MRWASNSTKIPWLVTLQLILRKPLAFTDYTKNPHCSTAQCIALDNDGYRFEEFLYCSKSRPLIGNAWGGTSLVGEILLVNAARQGRSGMKNSLCLRRCGGLHSSGRIFKHIGIKSMTSIPRPTMKMWKGKSWTESLQRQVRKEKEARIWITPTWHGLHLLPHSAPYHSPPSFSPLLDSTLMVFPIVSLSFSSTLLLVESSPYV